MDNVIYLFIFVIIHRKPTLQCFSLIGLCYQKSQKSIALDCVLGNTLISGWGQIPAIYLWVEEQLPGEVTEEDAVILIDIKPLEDPAPNIIQTTFCGDLPIRCDVQSMLSAFWSNRQLLSIHSHFGDHQLCPSFCSGILFVLLRAKLSLCKFYTQKIM